MSTLTIHALEPSVEKRIRAKAEREGRSLNQTLKVLLAESVGMQPTRSSATDYRAEFSEFKGVWSKRDAQEFQAAVADLERVNMADWTS